MAAKTTGGKPRASLPAADLGRMISRLRTSYQYTRVQGRAYYQPQRVNTGRWFTDEQIMDAFGLTKTVFDRCVKEHRESHRVGRNWNTKKVRDAFFAFVDREKRWPTEWDSLNWRETGLPYRSTIDTWTVDGYGRLVEDYCRTHRSKCTPALVFSIRNLTTRRNVITLIGIEKLIGKGELIQQDDFGKLWKLPKDSVDPHALYVEVVNKSPRVNEKTGKVVENKSGDPVFDHYFLRVPHNMRSAKDAVAWTLNIPAAEFAGFAAES